MMLRNFPSSCAAIALSFAVGCSGPAHPSREAANSHDSVANSASYVPEDPRETCAQAKAAALPAVKGSDENVGEIVKRTYRLTKLPRPDGRTAIVLTDVEGTARIGIHPNYAYEAAGSLVAYHEDEACWAEMEGRQTFGCSQTGSSREDPGIADRHSRAVLSILTYFATKGASDGAAERLQLTGERTDIIEATRLTGAPSFLDKWYFCQTCGRSVDSLSNKPISLQGLRFGRSQDATFFITRSGVTAKLRDGEVRATYAACSASVEGI